MGILESIIAAIAIFFGALIYLALYFLVIFLGWLESSRGNLIEIGIFIGVLALLVVVIVLLRRWINAQLVSR